MATTKVELYNGATLVATKTSAPFTSIDWTPATTGAATLTAKRYEDGVLVATSSVKNYTVASANTAPTTTADSYTASQDEILTVAAPGVLANDTDTEADTLTAILVSQATNGTVNLSSDGSFTYTPNAGYTGADSFTYKSNDGTVDGNTVAVTLDVQVVLSGMVASSETMVLSTDYKMGANQPGVLLNSPTIHYKNGKTYFAYLTDKTHRYGVLEYDNVYGVRLPHLLKGADGNYDTHDVPVINFQGDRMYVSQENFHNTFPSTYHKATVDNESFIIQPNIGTIADQAITYHLHFQHQGKKVIVGQYLDSLAGYTVNALGDIETAWSDVSKLCDLSAQETERYQLTPFNYALSSDIIVISAGRNDGTPIPTWFRYNALRLRVNANGYLDIYTFDGRLVKTGSVGSTSADPTQMLDTQFYYTGSNTANGNIPVSSLDQDENLYVIHGNGSGDYVLTIWKLLETTPISRAITFPDAPTFSNLDQTIPCTILMTQSLAEISSFWQVNNGTRTILREYKSVDEGVTWAFVQDIDFGIDIKKSGIAHNYLEVGNNNNTLLVACGQGNNVSANDGTAVTLVAKRAAFGAIQAESVSNYYDTLTPISDAVYNSSAIASYFVESGKITNTGTTLNTLIDQSANANNLTAEGSPVIDNATTPTEMTFDGVNDAFNINPALLQANKRSYLVIAVVDSLGGYAAPYTITNNTNTNSFIYGYLEGGTALRMQNTLRPNETALQTVRGDTPITAGHHIYAWLYRGGDSEVTMWLDGKQQLREISSPTSAPQEGSYILPNGNTHMSLGKLVRTTTSYYNYKMKHFAIHDVNSYADVLDRFKFLSNKYGITLLNTYR